MWPNPWVKRSTTQSPSTLRSVGIFLTNNQSIKCVVYPRKCEKQAEIFLSKWRGQAERLVAWWNRPSPRGSIFPTMTMLYGENSVNPIMFIYQSTIFQGVWLWMSGAPWSFAPWGEGEWGRSIFCHGYHVTKQYSKWSHLTKAKDVVLENVERKFCLDFWIFAGEPNQNGNEDCTAMDPQNEGYGVSWLFKDNYDDKASFHKVRVTWWADSKLLVAWFCKDDFEDTEWSDERPHKWVWNWLNYLFHYYCLVFCIIILYYVLSLWCIMQWMDLDCSQENHGVPHYTVCEKIIEAWI